MALTAKQLEMRRTGISSTDIAAIIGMNPHKSPTRVCLQKWGEDAPDEQTEPQYWGLALEDCIAQRYRRDHFKPGDDMVSMGTQRHKTNSWMIATPDRFIIPINASWYLLECKTAASYQQVKRWGRGGDQIPEEYLVQCGWQMAVLDLNRCDVGVLLGTYQGFEYREYTLKRDMDFEAWLIEKGRDAWFNYIKKHLTLPPGGTLDAGRALAEQYSEVVRPTRPPMGDDDELADELLVAREEFKRAELHKREIENALKASLKDCEGIDGERYTVRWTKTKKGRRFSATFRDEETSYDRIRSHGTNQADAGDEGRDSAQDD